ncbi:MAG: efflux RND transporter permease subunit, partial [Spirochaetales bacterium]|nr:efflux RND transporter permease subunit [Spirochaetales bacterium]
LSMHDDLIAEKDVLGLTSYYSILYEINRVMNIISSSDDILESKGLLMLLTRYFKLLGDTGSELTYGANAEFINDEQTQVTIFLKVCNGEEGQFLLAEEAENLLYSIDNIIEKRLPDVKNYYCWGNTIVNLDAAEQVQQDQLQSALLSMILVFLVSTIFFRSFRYGAFSLIPLVTAISFNYIVMSLFHIPLDLTTVLVSNVAIGVGVDDAIHFLLQYKKQYKLLNGDRNAAVQCTYLITGRPIILTTISIVAGFLVLCAGSFKPVVFFGVLVSFSLFAAMFSTLIFLPSLILVFDKLIKRKSKKEFLSK